MIFHLSIKGGSEMNYRIVDKEAFNIVGIKKRVPIVFEGENQEITEMWKTLTPDSINQLEDLSNLEPKGLIQASTNFSEGRMEEKGTLDHYIGVATTKEAEEGFSALHVPAYTWAVFTSSGPFPAALQETWGRIYSEWFPSSGYEQSKGPEILAIKSNDLSSAAVESEIWIAVLKRK
jgi:AraC family transcriptional regulator